MQIILTDFEALLLQDANAPEGAEEDSLAQLVTYSTLERYGFVTEIAPGDSGKRFRVTDAGRHVLKMAHPKRVAP